MAKGWIMDKALLHFLPILTSIFLSLHAHHLHPILDCLVVSLDDFPFVLAYVRESFLYELALIAVSFECGFDGPFGKDMIGIIRVLRFLRASNTKLGAVGAGTRAQVKFKRTGFASRTSFSPFWKWC